MAANDIAAALQRVETVLRRRPETGLHDDAPATARWDGGLRVTASHANGTRMHTDMPAELGGSGERVTPGWLLRAGVASCTVTRIAMAAAAEGIALQSLEVATHSRSDTRGLLALALADVDGEPVSAGPSDVQVRVRIAAAGVSSERLRTLVEQSYDCSPMACALRASVPVALHVEIDAPAH